MHIAGSKATTSVRNPGLTSARCRKDRLDTDLKTVENSMKIVHHLEPAGVESDTLFDIQYAFGLLLLLIIHSLKTIPSHLQLSNEK